MVRLLGVKGRPHPVAAEKVEPIKAIVAGNRSYYPWRMLKHGMHLRISEGLLTGTVGIILKAARSPVRPGGGDGAVPETGGGGVGRRSGRTLELRVF